MAAFTALQDVSKSFEESLRRSAVDLVAIKIGDTFESDVAKKFKDLSLFSSKLRLLRANPTSHTPQVAELQKTEESTVSSYVETLRQRIIEQQVVKSLTQSHAIRKLMTTDDALLDEEFIKRKQTIASQLEEYKQNETQLRLLDGELNEKRDRYENARMKWDQTLLELKIIKAPDESTDGSETPDPLYRKLRKHVQRMELFRFLLSKLMTSRTTGYDWLSDPDNRLPLLKLTRQQNTIAMFTEDS